MIANKLAVLQERDKGIGIFFVNKDEKVIDVMVPEVGDSITLKTDQETIVAEITKKVNPEVYEVTITGFEPPMTEKFVAGWVGKTLLITDKEILTCGKAA